MSDYKKIVEDALRKAKLGTKQVNEVLKYPEGSSERMHPKLEDDLAKGNHSLGKHPVFPDGDESSFEQKIMSKRFDDVTKRYKRAHDVTSVNNQDVMRNMMPLVRETMGLEKLHRKALEKLAVDMIREEYAMDADIVEIHAELTDNINMVGTKKNAKPESTDTEFKNHDELKNANDEVYKRRFLNAMTQGAAKHCNHMFHMKDEELTDLDPRLMNRYSKMMASADFMYYVIPEMENGVSGGVVRVQFPTKDNPKAVIYAQAKVFPVLIHELVKGVMEILSAHGLPKNKKVGEYVINKADFLSAEPWDMRLGPALWSKFTENIDPDDFHLKHHIYMELAALPVQEFNVKMKEIMAGTKEGNKIIKNIVDDVKKDFKEDEFNDAMRNISGEETDDEIDEVSDGTDKPDTFSADDILGNRPDDNSDDDSDGWKFEELF